MRIETRIPREMVPPVGFALTREGLTPRGNGARVRSGFNSGEMSPRSLSPRPAQRSWSEAAARTSVSSPRQQRKRWTEASARRFFDDGHAGFEGFNSRKQWESPELRFADDVSVGMSDLVTPRWWTEPRSSSRKESARSSFRQDGLRCDLSRFRSFRHPQFEYPVGSRAARRVVSVVRARQSRLGAKRRVTIRPLEVKSLMKARSLKETLQELKKLEEQPYGIPETTLPTEWDVVGLGQAMIDLSASVGDEFLESLGLVKGTRKVIDHEEKGVVVTALNGGDYKVTAGGSLSNTLVGLARLGKGYNGDEPLHVAMTGSVGSDPLGKFYRNKLLRANVHFLTEPIVDGTTGTVIVCTTPDAQRTMLSYQGTSSSINLDEAMAEQISNSKVLVVEGYLWELPETVETIARACKSAREQGILVALTASDVSCVNRHRERMWDVVNNSADILFTNADEARALLCADTTMTASSAAKELSKYCPLVSVTNGAHGSYLGLHGVVVDVQPAGCLPVDTCGAGDAYAAGLLYGLLRGNADLKGIGNLAARVAAVVVGQQGTRLKEEDARELTTSITSVGLLGGVSLNFNTEEEEETALSESKDLVGLLTSRS